MTSHPRTLRVTDVNPHLLCVLCGGYYVDATTIIECLHSFCKSCLVRYLETNKYCPICDVQVHKTKPLLNIRSDRTLQAIVYKLVPGLFQRELSRRKEFYKNCPGSSREDENNPIFLPDEPVLLGVQYSDTSSSKETTKRYLRCPAAITVCHLQKLMRAKFNLNDNQKVEFLHGGDVLPDHLSLMDLAYMYNWKRKHPVELEYRLLEWQPKKIKLSNEESVQSIEENKHTSSNRLNLGLNNNDVSPDHLDREVQLQISESGVMSVQSVGFNLDTLNDTVLSPQSENNTGPVSSNSLPVKGIQPETIELMKSLEKTVSLNLDSSLAKDIKSDNRLSPIHNSSPPNVDTEQVTKTSVNITLAINDSTNESSNDVKLKHTNHHDDNVTSRLPNFDDMSTSSASLTVQRVYPGAVKDVANSSKPLKSKETKTNNTEHEANLRLFSQKQEQPKPLNNIRYKTLKAPVKPWNPTIPRSAMLATKQGQASQEKIDSLNTTPPKAPKFFKMRNVPRFLGNPASGVKPMYQALPGAEPSTQTSQTSASQTSKFGNEVTVMKIDPKTLNPIQVSQSVKPKLTSSTNKITISLSNSQKSPECHQINSRTPIRNPVTKSNNMSIKTPSSVHSSLTPNPFILPSAHSPNMMYGGFPRTFPPVDSLGNRLPTDNQIFRAMSMLCSPSAAFHPSLPPSISMLFNPHHPHHRSVQNDKINLKYNPNDVHKASTPSVQRIPPSCPTSKHSLGVLHSPITANEASKSMSNSHDYLANTSTKTVNYEQMKDKELEVKRPSARIECKTAGRKPITCSEQEQLQSRSTDISGVSLSNGLSMPKSSTDSLSHLSSINKEVPDKLLFKKTVDHTNREENTNSFFDKSSCST